GGIRRVRRLSRSEYQAVLSDLVGATLPDLGGLPADALEDGFDNNADHLAVSDVQLEEFSRIAEAVARRVPLAEGAPRPPGVPAARCVHGFLDSFVRRAWGRPLTSDELVRFQELFLAGADPDGYAEGIRTVAEAALQSPHFLYRTEMGAERPGWVG